MFGAPVATYRELRAAIRRRRESMGLAPSDVDASAGLASGHQERLERGISNFRKATLGPVLDALNLSLELRPRARA